MSAQRLFVDCDDTLLLFDDGAEAHPYGFWKGDKYRINVPLVDYVTQFRKDNPCALVVIWSGGGREYAEEVKRAVFGDFDAVTMVKDRTTFHMVREWDLVVDDQDLGVRARVMRPDDPEIISE
jgi:hypothetical protein